MKNNRKGKAGNVQEIIVVGARDNNLNNINSVINLYSLISLVVLSVK